MRIVEYSLAGGTDAAAVGQVLAALEPDVACVLGAGGGRRSSAIARASGLTVAVRCGRRGQGIALLVAPDVRVRTTVEVPLSSPRHAPDRGAVHAILGVAGLRVSVTAIQFGLRPDVRLHNLEELRAHLATLDPPAVVAASINESIGGAVAGALASEYQDAFGVAGTGMGDTYPSEEPVARRDFVFVDHRLRVMGAHVPDDANVRRASRHRPVVADIDDIAARGDAVA